MSQADEIEDEEALDALLEVSLTPEGREALAGCLADVLLHPLPTSPSRRLLFHLRLLRNLLAGDATNQETFVLLSGAAAVSAAILPAPSPEAARAGLQALGNAALAGEPHCAAVWDSLFPAGFRELAGVRDGGVVDPLGMVLDTCCSGEGGRGRLEELCHEAVGLPILVEVVTTASQVGHKEEWLEWLLFKICVEEQKFDTLFAALFSANDVESSHDGESECTFNAKHAFLLGALSKCLSKRPKEVTVSNSFALDVFNVLKHAAEIVDFTSRGRSPLPTGSPAIDVLGYSLLLLRDISAWEHPTSSETEAPVDSLLEAVSEAPVDSLLEAGLLNHLLTVLRELEPPTTIRKSMARQQGTHPSVLATSKVCPYIGYRRDLVSIIGNCLHRRKQVQDEVRQLNGILLLLQHCVLDEENPYLREWGIVAVKNLLEGNVENQNEVAQLEMQEPVITPEIAEIGVRVEIDKENGRAKLVNIS